MGDSPNENPGDREKAAPETAKSAAGASGDTPKTGLDENLPVVESPKLAGDDVSDPAIAEADRDEAGGNETDSGKTAGETAGAVIAVPAKQRSRFLMLATTIALAAGLGSFIGSLTAAGVGRLWSADPAAVAADAHNVPQALNHQLAELTAIKSVLDSTSRSTNAQFAKISERLDHVERAQMDPVTQLAHIADTVDRLDKRGDAASDITGSIPANRVATIAMPKPPVLDGWIVEDVEGGRALIANRNGGEFDIGTGSFLPGIGRIEAIKRQDGQWVVVTASGLITSGR